MPGISNLGTPEIPPPGFRFPCRPSPRHGASCGRFRGWGIRSILPHQCIKHAGFGIHLRLSFHILAAGCLDHAYAGLKQITDHLVHITAHIARFGELGGLHLQEWRIGEPRQAPRNLGLADAGGPDHQDILRRDFLAHLAGELLPAPAVSQRNRHGALRVVLADDVTVEFGDNFTGREVGHTFTIVITDQSCNGLARRQILRERSTASMFRYPGTEWLPSGTQQQTRMRRGSGS